MKAVFLVFLCLVLGAGVVLPAGCSPRGLSEEELDGLAREFAAHVVAEEYAAAVEMMNRDLRETIPEAVLGEVWAGLTAQLGAYEQISGTRYDEADGFRMIFVTLRLAGAEVDMRVVFGADGEVTGLWFGQPRMLGENAYSPPAYADPDLFTETEVAVAELPGTLTLPVGQGPFPAVVLVHGSGPQDRDETLWGNKPFKDLAWGLASQGVAVLRYEKRTKHLPTEAAALDFDVNRETVDDAVAAVRLLRETDGVDGARVFVLGHSLGGMMAPRIAARLAPPADEPPAGLILAAANARDLLTLIVEQCEYLAALDGEVDEAEAGFLDQLRAQVGRIRDGTADPAERLLGGTRAAYWADLLNYDQVATAQALDLPMLFVQGERDYQVTMTEFGLWQEALAGRDDVTFASYAALNHLLIAGEGQPGPGEFEVAGNVAEELVNDVAAWVKGR